MDGKMATSGRSDEARDRQLACRKLFLSLAPSLLQLHHHSDSRNEETKLRRRNARKRQSSGRFRRNASVAWTSKLRTLYIPSILTKGLTLTPSDELTAERRLWTRERSSMWWDVVVKEHWSDQDWIDNFRMTKATFLFICEKMRDKLTYHNTNMRRALPVEQRMAITIWRLATNCGYRVIGDLFGVGVSTVCIIIQQTCKAFASSMQQEFLSLPDKEKLKDINAGFMSEYGFPQVGGCIGVCHIPIKRPDSAASLQYINAAGNPTVVVQGVVDNKGRFLYVSSGWHGSIPDALILKQSDLHHPLRQGSLFEGSPVEIEGVNVPPLVIGGAGYHLQTNVMVPYQGRDGTLNNGQRLFNKQLNHTHEVINDAFSRLKGRWQILLKRNEHKIAFLPEIVTTCCILHNICEGNGEPYSPELQDQDTSNPRSIPVAQDADLAAEGVRHALATYFVKKLAHVE